MILFTLILALLDAEEADRLEILFRLTNRMALALANSVLQNRHDAEEVVQEAFLRVALHIDKIQDPHSDRAKNYVLKITKNLAIDRWHLRQRRGETHFEEGDAGVVGSVEDGWLDEEQYRRLIACIRKLEEPYQTVLYFHLVERLRAVTIAKLLGKKANTVEQQLLRGRQRLKTMILKEVLGDE